MEEDFDPVLAVFLDRIGSSIKTRKVPITDPKQMVCHLCPNVIFAKDPSQRLLQFSNDVFYM